MSDDYKTFTLKGEEFRCIPKLPALFLSDAVKSARDGGSGALVGTLEFVLRVVIPEDQERLGRMLASTVDVVEFDDLNAVVSRLSEAYFARPTTRPSDSPAGGLTTAMPPRVVSLSRAPSEETKTSGRGRRAAS